MNLSVIFLQVMNINEEGKEQEAEVLRLTLLSVN